MSQQINLLGAAFRKQRQMLSAGSAAQALGAVMLALFAFQYYAHQQIKWLDADLQTALKEQQSRAENLKAETAARSKMGTTLDAEIARLETEVKLGRASMDALKAGSIGNRQGFAEYLQAFSRQAIDGLWLTGFTIVGGGDITIEGRVIQPELVPNYIQRLNREKVLQGRTFATLEMHVPKPAPAGAADAKAPKQTPRYLEFSLTTAEPGAAVASAGGAK
jgi:hypothetical protein